MGPVLFQSPIDERGGFDQSGLVSTVFHGHPTRIQYNK